jgi:hypothetical protein
VINNTEEQKAEKLRKTQVLRELFKLTAQIYTKSFDKPCPYKPDMLGSLAESQRFWSEMDQTYLDTKKLKDILTEVEYSETIK